MSAPPDVYGAPGRRLVLILLCAWTALQAAWLLPMVWIGGPEVNDHVLHASLAQMAADRIAAGQDPLDFWVPHIGLGFPVFHHYQHLPHVAVGLLHLATGRAVDPYRLVELVSALLLMAWPWVVFRSLRSMRIDGWSALGAALVAPLVSCGALLGIGYQSYGWAGFGLFTQLVAMILFLPAVAAMRRTMLGRGGWASAVGLLALTALCHPAYGLMAAGTGVLLVGSAPQGGRSKALVRLLGIGAMTAVVTSYFVLPLWIDRSAAGHSVWERPDKWNGPGHHQAWRDAVAGYWFDDARLPLLSALALAGGGLAVTGRGGRAGRWGLAMALAWAVLYVGRPTWGQLLDLVPLMRSFHVHRLIAAVQMGGVLLAGLAVGRAAAWAWRRAGNLRWRREAAAAGVLVAALAYPAADWTIRHAANHRLQRENREAVAEWLPELQVSLETVSTGSRGRLYPGQARGWGNSFRAGYTPVHLWLTAMGVDTIAFQNHSLSPASDAMLLFDEGRRGHYQLFNVRHTLSPPGRRPPLTGVELHRGEHTRLTATPGGGYFALIRADQEVRGETDWLHQANRVWMADAGPETGEHLRLIQDPPERFAPRTPYPRVHSGGRRPGGAIEHDQFGSGRAGADVVLDEDALVMLKATYHPRWAAEVDGAVVPTQQVTPGFVAVPVSAGKHHVEFTYRAQPWRLPLALLGAILVGGVALLEWRLRRRAESPLAPLVELPAGALGVAWDLLSTRGWIVRLRPAALPLAAMGTVALLAGLPLLHDALPSGHDILQYLPRLIEFHRSVEAGHLMPAWAPDLAGGRGLPLFLYTPALSVGIAEGLFLVLRHPVTALNGAALVLLLVSSAATFAWLRRWTGDDGAAVAGAAVALAPYTLTNLYVRGSLDELACFATIPVALWAVDRAVDRADARGVGWLGVAVGLLCTTEVALLWIVVPPVLAYGAARAMGARPGERGRAALRLAGGGALGIGLAAWVMAPAILQRNLVHSERLAGTAATYHQHFLEGAQWFRGGWGYGTSVEGPGDGMAFGLGAAHLVGIAAAALMLARGNRSLPRGLTAGVLAVLLASLAMTIPASAPIWRGIAPLQELVFPWRFLLLASLASAALTGLALRAGLAGLPRDTRRLVIAGAIGVLALLSLPKARPYRAWPIDPSQWTADALAGTNRSATWRGELQPTWAESPPAGAVASPFSMPATHGQIQRFERTGLLEIEMVAEVRRPTELVLGTYYFPGWTAVVDGVPAESSPQPGTGLLSIPLPEGKHDVVVRYRPTATQQAARALTGGSSVAVLGLIVLGYRRKIRSRV